MLDVVKTIVVDTSKAKYWVVPYLVEFSNMNENSWLVAGSLRGGERKLKASYIHRL